MHLSITRRGRRLVAAAATLGLVGMPLLATTTTSASAATKPPAVTVMTRNLYLGADIMRPIAAVQEAQAGGASSLQLINAFANANDATSDVVVQTDFDTRVTMLASELVTAQPDLVGLQEVALWRTGPMDQIGGPDFLDSNATTVEYDFLKQLLAELKAQGEPYKALSVNTLSDVEGPAFSGSLGAPTDPRDVRLTMRDVILKRVDSTVQVVQGSATKKTYDAKLSFDISGKAFDFLRGYQWVDLTSGAKQFRFINTHLEAFGSGLAFAQAEQLLGDAGAYQGTTILTCDCNSDPANGDIKPNDTKRHWASYFRLIRGGFNDTWIQRYAPEDGFTSGLSETVDDEDASGFDHRIDFVFARTATGDKLPVVTGDVTGNELGDQDTDTGLWPSDHAGVVMRLRLR